MNDDTTNWFIQRGKNGKKISAEAQALTKLLDSMSRIYGRVVDAENKSQQQLSVKDIYIIIQQMKVSFNETCGSCPVRKNISNKISNTKMGNVVEDATIITEQNK